MRIIVNPDKNIVALIREGLKERDGYCPCKVEKIKENKCLCKDFLEQTEPGPCHCGLYIKEKEDV